LPFSAVERDLAAFNRKSTWGAAEIAIGFVLRYFGLSRTVLILADADQGKVIAKRCHTQVYP
jgi:hypothetical protein